MKTKIYSTQVFILNVSGEVQPGGALDHRLHHVHGSRSGRHGVLQCSVGPRQQGNIQSLKLCFSSKDAYPSKQMSVNVCNFLLVNI